MSKFIYMACIVSITLLATGFASTPSAAAGPPEMKALTVHFDFEVSPATADVFPNTYVYMAAPSTSNLGSPISIAVVNQDNPPSNRDAEVPPLLYVERLRVEYPILKLHFDFNYWREQIRPQLSGYAHTYKYPSLE
jgi:hypothetical protein